jgi:ComF family protein
MRLPLARLRLQALDLLFPPMCGVCRAGGSFLCDACRRRLPEAAPPRCSRCWRQMPSPAICRDCARSPLDGAWAPFVFAADARTLVHALKYDSLHALAEPMAELLAASLVERTRPAGLDLVVPVPLHFRRRLPRGFNQSELLARGVAARAGIELDTRSLRRVRNTRSQLQAGDRAGRERNVRAAFRCGTDLRGRHVLLVDDVLTTGATLRECAATLKAAGAASVYGLAFCCAG